MVVTALAPLAWLITSASIGGLLADPHTRDFGSFYASGLGHRTARPDLNPPWLAATLFARLARLEVHDAALVWTIVGAIGLCVSLLVVVRVVRPSVPMCVGLIVWVGLSYPAAHIWNEGQIVWWLMLPMTLAWQSYRSGHLGTAGLWLGLVIAVKPFLVVTLLMLGWPVARAAVLVAATISSLALVRLGLDPWLTWWANGQTIDWFALPANASWWAWSARLLAIDRVSAWLSVGLAAYLMASGAVVVRRHAHPDDRWLGAGLLALLMSPLGWIYYVPLWLGAVCARPTWLRITLAALLVLPQDLIIQWGWFEHPFLSITIGSWYFWCLATLFAGTCLTLTSAHATLKLRPRHQIAARLHDQV